MISPAYNPKKYKMHLKYKDMHVYSSEDYYLSVEDFLNRNQDCAKAVKRSKLTVTRSLNETSS